MRITKDIEKQIILADILLRKNGYVGYDWVSWLKEGITNEWYPWCCDSQYEAAGWLLLEYILVATGNREKIKEFKYEEDAEEFHQRFKL